MSIRKIYTTAEYHHMVASLMKEKEWQQQVIEIARTYNYLTFHDYDSRMNARGFLDVVLAKPGRLIFAELKSEQGKLRPEQETWIEYLSSCPGVEVYVWRPSDIDKVIEILQKTA